MPVPEFDEMKAPAPELLVDGKPFATIPTPSFFHAC